jgi:hypothetical protein
MTLLGSWAIDILDDLSAVNAPLDDSLANPDEL